MNFVADGPSNSFAAVNSTVETISTSLGVRTTRRQVKSAVTCNFNAQRWPCASTSSSKDKVSSLRSGNNWFVRRSGTRLHSSQPHDARDHRPSSLGERPLPHAAPVALALRARLAPSQVGPNVIPRRSDACSRARRTSTLIRTSSLQSTRHVYSTSHARDYPVKETSALKRLPGETGASRPAETPIIESAAHTRQNSATPAPRCIFPGLTEPTLAVTRLTLRVPGRPPARFPPSIGTVRPAHDD